MADRSVLVKYLDDITECPICTNIFSDPRVLPCIHTFCLKCIKGWAASRKQDEHTLACPLCRKEITVTTEQVVGLPKNLFVEKLLEVKRLTGQVENKTVMCEVCDESKPAGVATVYCTECQQNMCSQCSASHKKMKVSASHRLVDVGSQKMKADELLVKLSDSSCAKHRNELVKIFCLECKTALCMMCYIKDHKSHDCEDINEVAEELSQQMKDDCDSIEETADEYRKRLENLSQREKQFGSKTCQVEKEIVEKCEEMKRAIETQKVALVAELTAAKKQELKKIETLRHELEGQLMMIDSFMKYSQQLREKGSACDIAREVSGLRARAKELHDMSSRGPCISETQIVDVTFSVAGNFVNKLKDIVGKLTIGDTVDISSVDIFLSCKPLKVMQCDKRVEGVGTIGDEVFVVECPAKKVDVYEATTFKILRHLSLSAAATEHNQDLAACRNTKNIYVSDIAGDMIHKVSADGKTPAVSWSVGRSPIGLSINSNYNVLVACRDANKIQEYTPRGALVREILLQSDIGCPVVALQLSGGQYGVTHEGELHRYCVIDATGKLIKSYGSTPGSGAGQLHDPDGLTISKRGFIFVANYRNNRVVVLEPTTFAASELCIEGGFKGPYCVHIDHSRGRLYVGESTGHRLIVLSLPAAVL